jgi:hypothetical protein
MKIKTILTSTLMLALTALQAQTKSSTTKPTIVNNQCDEWKKENDRLLKALSLNAPMATDSENDIDGKVIKVIGDKKSQTVVVEILLTNKIENCSMHIDYTNVSFQTKVY